jgi:hypothetical protein
LPSRGSTTITGSVRAPRPVLAVDRTRPEFDPVETGWGVRHLDRTERCTFDGGFGLGFEILDRDAARTLLALLLGGKFVGGVAHDRHGEDRERDESDSGHDGVPPLLQQQARNSVQTESCYNPRRTCDQAAMRYRETNGGAVCHGRGCHVQCVGLPTAAVVLFVREAVSMRWALFVLNLVNSLGLATDLQSIQPWRAAYTPLRAVCCAQTRLLAEGPTLSTTLRPHYNAARESNVSHMSWRHAWPEAEGMRKFLIFVSIPSGEPFKRLYEAAIKPLSRGNLEVLCFFDDREPGAFENTIRFNVAYSNIVISVLTGNNPNVLFETGLALGYGKPVILLTERIKELSSMVAHLEATEYGPSTDLGTLTGELPTRQVRSAPHADTYRTSHATWRHF